MNRYIWRERERDKEIKRDTDNDAAVPAALVAPEVPPLLMRRLPIAQSRRFSDSSSHLLLLLSFIPSASVSYLAIAVAAAFRKNLVASASARSARDLQKMTDRLALGPHVTLAPALQRIPLFLAVALVYF